MCIKRHFRIFFPSFFLYIPLHTVIVVVVVVAGEGNWQKEAKKSREIKKNSPLSHPRANTNKKVAAAVSEWERARQKTVKGKGWRKKLSQRSWMNPSDCRDFRNYEEKKPSNFLTTQIQAQDSLKWVFFERVDLVCMVVGWGEREAHQERNLNIFFCLPTSFNCFIILCVSSSKKLRYFYRGAGVRLVLLKGIKTFIYAT